LKCLKHQTRTHWFQSIRKLYLANFHFVLRRRWGENSSLKADWISSYHCKHWTWNYWKPCRSASAIRNSYNCWRISKRIVWGERLRKWNFWISWTDKWNRFWWKRWLVLMKSHGLKLRHWDRILLKNDSPFWFWKRERKL